MVVLASDNNSIVSMYIMHNYAECSLMFCPGDDGPLKSAFGYNTAADTVHEGHAHSAMKWVLIHFDNRLLDRQDNRFVHLSCSDKSKMLHVCNIA